MKVDRKFILSSIIGTAILSFGMINIHQAFLITEGGVLGGVLLINYWTGLHVSVVSVVLDCICYGIAFKYFGKEFIYKAIITSLFIGVFLRFWQLFPNPMMFLKDYKILTALVGGLFVGVSVGIVIRGGSSSGGDDALALVISKKFKMRLSATYMFTDLSVLFLSLSYIPLINIFYSIITVTVSSYTIDYFSKLRMPQFIKDFFVQV